jgi:hypothetical protein
MTDFCREATLTKMGESGEMSEKKQSYCAGCSEAELKLFEPAIKKLISLANEEILPRFLAGTEVFDKKDHTPVTAADRGAEKVMREWNNM